MEPTHVLPYIPFILLVPIVLVLVLFGLLGIFKELPLPPLTDYEKQESLLTPAELVFFNVLVLYVPPDCYVLAKVRIGDLVRVSGLIRESSEWWRKFGPIAKKHVDYVIVERTSFTPCVVLELDDRSHERLDRQARDTLVDRVMHAAGLPILHISYSHTGYNRSQVETLVHDAMYPRKESPGTAGAGEGSPAFSAAV